MAKAPLEQPVTKTFADHEVFAPSTRLRKAIGRGRPADDDPVARAEAALASLSSEFDGWMEKECDRLDMVRRELPGSDFVKTVRGDLFRAAHDIKGDADTFGYPLAARVAESLCRLIEHTPDTLRVPRPLIDQHVDAVRAIIRESKERTSVRTATKLAASLRTVTDQFLAHENRDRPDYLDDILGPPLAPREPAG